MKRLYKALALFLAVTISLLLFVPCFAQDEDPYAQLKEGTGYVAIGDSFARGFGASDNWESQLYENEYYGHYECRNVDGSYPNLVAQAFGLNAPNDIRDMSSRFWPITHDALSTAFMLDLLGIDDGFRDEGLIYTNPLLSNRYETDLAYFGDPLSMNFEGTGAYGKTGEIMSIRDMLENASLITVGLGQTDVIYRTLYLELYNADFSDAGKIPSIIAGVVSALYENYERWKSTYPVFLDYLKKNNPDAKVVLVGTMNPLQNAMLSDDVLLPVGSAVNLILDLINKFNRECAEKYGYMFVDISNVETVPSENNMVLTDMLAMDLGGKDFALLIHPNKDGYEQIARMIISAVKEDLAKDAGEQPSAAKTYIKVDLGRFTNVSFVALDNKKVNSFTVQDHVLTVPCGRTDARNLTVAAVDGGVISFMTYNLQYDNGYTAYRMYLSNNLLKTIVTTLKTIFTAITDLFKNLFA
ncbi:MAG: GDSL-type esterase/lipase family protein [Clostridia bacterium]|nr:GDSL-type esterase/lipase family protein [Clostridia bacterium]